MTGKVDSVSHSSGSSTVKLQGSDVTISGSLVLDATGHSRRLVQFDKKFDPGYQGAYGIIAGEQLLGVAGFCAGVVRLSPELDPGYQGAYGIIAGEQRLFGCCWGLHGKCKAWFASYGGGESGRLQHQCRWGTSGSACSSS
jgi:hypothetical protein